MFNIYFPKYVAMKGVYQSVIGRMRLTRSSRGGGCNSSNGTCRCSARS